tara:strand:+ start:21 stop:881 length:861 start_codon:yes stop_codon:yes gene_type:complete
MSIAAKPFIKWAGGKYRLAESLIKFIPTNFDLNNNTYVEPMVGSGGFFFKYEPKNAYLSDINKNLITTYDVIKNDVGSLIDSLKKYKKLHNKTYFKKQRTLFNKLTKERENDLEIASLFIYLNKTCFNGLYRENSKGEFNVPIGRDSNGNLLPMSFDIDNLKNVHKLLQNIELACHGYEDSIDKIKEGDFVYIDPPYIPIDLKSFTKYSKDDFDKKEHKKLSDFCDSINNKGAYFMLSNSDTKDTRDIYLKEGRFSKKFSVSRSIASKGKNRVKAKEIIVTNYEIK